MMGEERMAADLQTVNQAPRAEPIESDERDANVRLTVGGDLPPEIGYDQEVAAERAIGVLKDVLEEQRKAERPERSQAEGTFAALLDVLTRVARRRSQSGD
jgi:hypothetical protein